jgi:lipopolysaccharide transport system ATP-binding protein
MAAVKRLCSRCLLLSGGALVFGGPTDSVVDRYLSSGSQMERVISWEPDFAPKSSELVLHSIQLKDGDGSSTSALSTAKPVMVEIEYTLLTAIRNLRIALAVQTTDSADLFESSDFLESAYINPRPPGRYVSTATIPSHLLNTGTYLLSVVAEIPNERELICPYSMRFVVEELASNQMGISLHGRPAGVIHPNLKWSVRRHEGKSF